jgi:hypothetical protein
VKVTLCRTRVFEEQRPRNSIRRRFRGQCRATPWRSTSTLVWAERSHGLGL